MQIDIKEKNTYEKTGTVLIAKSHTLVEIITSESDDYTTEPNYLITLDSQNLLRAWSLSDFSTTMFSYRIKLESVE